MKNNINYIWERIWIFANNCYSIFSISNTKKLKELKNKHKGERCFIIGNGPSLSFKDLESLKYEKTMVANSIIKTFMDLSFTPTYYFCQDPLVLKDNAAWIANENKTIKLIRSFYSKKYHFSDATYYNIYDYKMQFSNDITKGVYCGWTVTYSMIQFAVYMGFSEIYLLGVDFNYANNNTEINSDCYFDKRLFNKNLNYSLPKVDITIAAYEETKKFCAQNGIKISNATRGGKLEVFDRVNFDELDLTRV